MGGGRWAPVDDVSEAPDPPGPCRLLQASGAPVAAAKVSGARGYGGD